MSYTSQFIFITQVTQAHGQAGVHRDRRTETQPDPAYAWLQALAGYLSTTGQTYASNDYLQICGSLCPWDKKVFLKVILPGEAGINRL